MCCQTVLYILNQTLKMKSSCSWKFMSWRHGWFLLAECLQVQTVVISPFYGNVIQNLILFPELDFPSSHSLSAILKFQTVFISPESSNCYILSVLTQGTVNIYLLIVICIFLSSNQHYNSTVYYYTRFPIIPRVPSTQKCSKELPCYISISTWQCLHFLEW